MDIINTLILLQQAVIQRLKDHDWQHEMSDSFKIAQKGRIDIAEIEEMLSFFTFDRACHLYNKYAPKDDFIFDESNYILGKHRVEIRLANETFKIGA